MFRLSLLVFMIGIASCNRETPVPINSLLKTVSGDSVKAHIAYLADDSLKGRLPGTPEYDLAVNYVIKKYEEIGVEPAGDNGTYLQQVTIRKAQLVPDQSSMSIQGDVNQELIFGEDYVLIPDLNHIESAFEGEVVFAGYGIRAPDLQYDDYKNLDVKNKIVLIALGSPSSFPSTHLAHFSNYATKFETAEKLGAKGIILFVSPGSRRTFSSLASYFSRRGNTGVLGPDGVAYGRRVFGKGLAFAAVINFESLTKLMEDPSGSWDAYMQTGNLGEPAGKKIKVISVSEHTEFTTPNVVGKITGSDEMLKNEYVVHSAHLDHVGIGSPIQGDSIYNGAHDNASGVASCLEIARLYSQLKGNHKRSVLFVMVTAEEMGLLGSDYFTRFPTVPKESMVANVNTDMPTLIAPLLSIEPLGAQHSSLARNVQEAADQLGLEVREDHMPDEVRFVRSDQYNFIRQGIPALHVKYGLKSNDPGKDLTELINDYTANVYHKPSDELNDLFDFGAAEVYVKLNFLISYSIAQDEERPRWNEGDFFSRF